MHIKLTHNMEIAHRLFLMPGKCQQIHGHSMKVDLTLHGHPDVNGVFEGLDFSDVKKTFREYIDTEYDHKLLLNKDDPWAQPLGLNMHIADVSNDKATGAIERLPGLVICDGDPTTENLAMWIARWAHNATGLGVDIFIQETGTNGVGYSRR